MKTKRKETSSCVLVWSHLVPGAGEVDDECEEEEEDKVAESD